MNSSRMMSSVAGSPIGRPRDRPYHRLLPLSDRPSSTVGGVAVARGRVFKSMHLVDLCDAKIDEDVLVVSYPSS